MSGTLRIVHALGTSKIILSAVSSDKDFYVNGNAQVGGNHLVASIDSSAYIKGSNVQTNTFYALNTNDILFVTMYLMPSLTTLIIVLNLLDHVDAGNLTRTGNI